MFQTATGTDMLRLQMVRKCLCHRGCGGVAVQYSSQVARKSVLELRKQIALWGSVAGADRARA